MTWRFHARAAAFSKIKIAPGLAEAEADFMCRPQFIDVYATIQNPHMGRAFHA